jgi:PAS domain S-box-containing protein
MALLLITTLFIAMLGWVSRSYLRSRDPLLRDVMLIFASVGLLFVLAIIRVLGGDPPRAVAGSLAALLLGQPFLTLRLVSRLRRVPAWALWSAAGAWVLTAVPVVLMARPLPRLVVLPAIAAFFVVESAAGWLLAAEARRRGGSARIRLGCAAAGTALFGVALVIVGGGPVFTDLSRGVALVSAVMYVLAFAPPRWLRRMWSRGAAYGLIGQLLAAPVDEPPQRTWQRYCEGARRVLGADGVTVLLSTEPATVEPVAQAGLVAPVRPRYSEAEIEALLATAGTVDLHASRNAAAKAAADVVGTGGARFVSAAPLALDGRRGALILVNRYRTLFADDDVALFTEVARQAATMAGRAAVLAERQRLAVIVESSHDAIIGKTLGGVITSWNLGAHRLYGYDAEETIGRHASMLFPRDQEGVEAQLMAQIAAGERIEQYQVQRRRKDGVTVTVSLTLSPITEPAGTVVGVASISRDITEQLEAQAKAERLAAQAERDAAERRMQHTRRLESLGQLAGGVAHDFNNILAVIGSYTELSLETLQAHASTNDELVGVRADLLQVARATERATQLTKQLLAFGRRDVTQAEVLDLNHLIRDVEQMLRRAIGEHITLATDLNPELWNVHADPSQVEQILVNLAINARDAMPTGGALSIDTTNTTLDTDTDTDGSPSTAPSRYVRIRVSDTGIGMPPEVLERAFEPFYTTKPQGSGTGLGLATVYGIATAAGGDVRLYSEPGVGTTITVLLPATEAPTTAGSTNGNSADTSATDPAPRHETILVVEDEDALREVTTRILTHAGYQVLPADCGAAAIELAHHHPGPIHLLLSDVIMPKMMGNEVAAQVSAIRPGLPVLYMSGYAEPVLTEHGTLPTGVIIVEKPFTRRQLLDRIHTILHANSPEHLGTAAPAQTPTPTL